MLARGSAQKVFVQAGVGYCASSHISLQRSSVLGQRPRDTEASPVAEFEPRSPICLPVTPGRTMCRRMGHTLPSPGSATACSHPLHLTEPLHKRLIASSRPLPRLQVAFPPPQGPPWAWLRSLASHPLLSRTTSSKAHAWETPPPTLSSSSGEGQTWERPSALRPGLAPHAFGTAHPSQARGTHLTDAQHVGHDGLAKTGQGSEHPAGLGQGPLPASALPPQDTLGTTVATR